MMMNIDDNDALVLWNNLPNSLGYSVILKYCQINYD